MMQHLQPNTTLQGGKYRIEDVLGQGGFGITYLATQVSLNRRVAIKELFIGGEGQAINDRRGNQVVVTNSANQQSFIQQKEKFKKEALRLAQLNHPNLVKVHEFFEENGTAYFVMDYIVGESLRTKLNREGRLSESLVLNYMRQILPALEAAHKQSIWHLDIKPENIVVDKSDHAYLIDFGASKHIDKNSTLTTSLALAYTKGYCPPELSDLSYGSQDDLVQALKEIGPWTDIYALGATIYNLLTDSIPPSSNRLYRDGRNAFSFPNDVSSSTRELIVWMMKQKREERPQSILELLEYNKINNEKTIVENFVLLNKSNAYNLKYLSKNLDKYDDFKDEFHEGFAAVQRHGKWGFINMDGIETIPCLYEDCQGFYEGLSAAKKNEKWGFIDKENRVAIPYIYDYVPYPFSNEGFAVIEKDGKEDLIDKKGNSLLSYAYDYVDNFGNGLAQVTKNDKNGYNMCGYVDKKGELVIPLIYGCAGRFLNEFATVGKWERTLFIKHGHIKKGLIDKKGNEVVPLIYDEVWEYGPDGIYLVERNGKRGFVDRNGREIIPCIYENARNFISGLAPVMKNGKWGFIDIKGNLVIPFQYLDVSCMENGLARVQNDNFLYGYVNIYGNESIQCVFHEATDFKDNIARVKINGKWGYIDKNGKMITPCIYDSAMWFNEGLAFVRKDGVLGCVDMEGRSSFDYK